MTTASMRNMASASQARSPAARTERKRRLQAEIRAERVAALVVNTRSRRGARLYSQALRLLEKRGYTVDASYPVQDPGRLPAIVSSLIVDGHKLVIVGGGDGTISSVVDHFAYENVVFGLLPLGTANSFARTLSIPLSVAGAIDVIAHGKVVDIDLARINDDYFANTASIGVAPAVARAVPRWDPASSSAPTDTCSPTHT